MLHLVNGDCFADRLREVVPGEDVLVWREALYKGPISAAFTDPATREARPALFY
ncbi:MULTISPECIES: hypothetical protein [Paenibacillus]|uniref:hypothetical protein n=1 Tax=Paenibacillus TaxID=44249 RepID=UPI0008855CAD|nr:MULTISPECIES: hypothetical protein [Paenibacillus]SDJ14894.1 hypothetical protein SAMN05421868_11873 [Paenibacillus naphthalenovorans]